MGDTVKTCGNRARTAVVPNGRRGEKCHVKRLLMKVEEVTELARPCYADNALVERCIEEAQFLDLRPVIGDEMYNELLTSTEYATLMEGGSWTDGCGRLHCFKGIKTALAYYTYGRVVRVGSAVQTRFGLVEKNDEYSYHASVKDRMAQYDEAFSIAYRHMADVADYVAGNLDSLPKCCGQMLRRIRPETVKFRVIGE